MQLFKAGQLDKTSSLGMQQGLSMVKIGSVGTWSEPITMMHGMIKKKIIPAQLIRLSQGHMHFIEVKAPFQSDELGGPHNTGWFTSNPAITFFN